MLTYPKSTMRVRRMPMHLSSGHVTLMPGKFYPPLSLFPPNFPQSDLVRRADSRWALLKFLVSPTKAIACGADLCFMHDAFLSSRNLKMRGPTSVQFCTMVSTRHYFIMPVHNFWGHTPKKFQGPKTCKI